MLLILKQRGTIMKIQVKAKKKLYFRGDLINEGEIFLIDENKFDENYHIKAPCYPPTIENPPSKPMTDASPQQTIRQTINDMQKPIIDNAGHKKNKNKR